VLRPGRLGGVISLGLPDVSERIDIVRRSLSVVAPEAIDIGDEGEFWSFIGERTESKTRGSCAGLCNEAGRCVVREVVEGGGGEGVVLIERRHFEMVL